MERVFLLERKYSAKDDVNCGVVRKVETHLLVLLFLIITGFRILLSVWLHWQNRVIAIISLYLSIMDHQMDQWQGLLSGANKMDIVLVL